jgi:hypothetical protein
LNWEIVSVMDGFVAAMVYTNLQGVEKDNKAARQYFETAAHLVFVFCISLTLREILKQPLKRRGTG